MKKRKNFKSKNSRPLNLYYLNTELTLNLQKKIPILTKK